MPTTTMIATAMRAVTAGSAAARRSAASSPRLDEQRRPGRCRRRSPPPAATRNSSATVSAATSSAGNAAPAHCAGGGRKPAAVQRLLRRRPFSSPSTNALACFGVLGALDDRDAVGDRAAAASSGSSIAFSLPSVALDVGDVDEAGVDRALGELADDAADVGLLGAHVGQDRLALRRRAACRAPCACRRRPARPRRRSRASRPASRGPSSACTFAPSAGTASTSRLPANTIGFSTRPLS